MRLDIDHNFEPPEIAGDSPVAQAASAVFRTENVLTRKTLLHRSFVEAALQGKGIKSVYSEISNLEASGKLVRLDDHEAPQQPPNFGGGGIPIDQPIANPSSLVLSLKI